MNPVAFGTWLLSQGFEKWFLYMFWIVEHRKFTVEPLHPELFELFKDIHKQEQKRVTINVPPRSAKTTLAKYFIAYSWTLNPACNFIYTSYSEDLLKSISKELAYILEHPVYKAMYPQTRYFAEDEVSKPADDFWEEYLRKETGKNTYSSKKITTYGGGTCLFSAMGAQITGYGCFSYDTLVLTESGYIKLGDIVENKLDIKVWSYNFKTNKQELQSIYDYVKNEKSEYLQLELDNGENINCTPDHIFYLENGSEIRADKLFKGAKIMSHSFNSRNSYVKFFCNFFSGMIFIKNKINFILSKILYIVVFAGSFLISLISKSFCNFFPNTTAFNIAYRAIRQSIIFSYIFVWAFVLCNCDSNFFSNFMEFMIGFIFIFHIFFTSTITKIFQSVVSGIRIKMSDLFVRFTDKGKQNKTMNKQRPISTIFLKIHTQISFTISVWFHKLVAFCGINKTLFRNIISLIFGYRKVVNIINCNHIAPSYCITLWYNNNLYITKSQVLVHNCGIRNAQNFSGALIIDDGNKPADMRSQTMREKVLRFYEETLLSRLNNSNVPIINIQQRLHVEDLSGLLDKKYHFYKLVKSLIDEKGVCQLPTQYTPERIKELQSNNYMFQAQYQQEPFILGGQVIKRSYFRYYNAAQVYKYKRILISADTAMKTKEHNDYSVFIVGGVTDNNELHILDLVRGKWEAPELEKMAVMVWNKFKRNPQTGLTCNGLYIEDKASGTGLIQGLKTKYGIPVFGVQASTDKLTRVENVLPYLEAGQVYLPENEFYGFNPDLLAECEAFSRDMSHLHDDQVDTLGIMIQEALGQTVVSILDYFMQNP